MNSKELFERAKKVIPGGVHSPVRSFQSVGGEPLFFKSAQGAYMTTVEGEELIDFCQSFGPNLLGHRDVDVAFKVQQMVQRAWSLGACDPYSLELSEWLVERLPWVDQVRLVSSGTEAVMSALRLARAATGRRKILKFEGCYHGHTDAMLVKAGSGLAGAVASDSAGVEGSLVEDTMIIPLDDEEKLNQVLQAQGSQMAAVILEPLPANYGLLKQRPSFIKKLFQGAKNCGALVIFDEVISGFRVGLQGMAGLLELSPDLVTYGKVMGGGFPMGCFGGRRDIMELVAPCGPVYQAGTLAAHPVATCAGLATLQKVEKRGVYGVLDQRMKVFVNSLQKGLEVTDWDITFQNSLFWFHLKSAEPYRSPRQLPPQLRARFQELFHGCVCRGVYLAPSAFEVNFLSLAHTEEILEKAAAAIVAAAMESTKGQALK